VSTYENQLHKFTAVVYIITDATSLGYHYQGPHSSFRTRLRLQNEVDQRGKNGKVNEKLVLSPHV